MVTDEQITEFEFKREMISKYHLINHSIVLQIIEESWEFKEGKPSS